MANAHRQWPAAYEAPTFLPPGEGLTSVRGGKGEGTATAPRGSQPRVKSDSVITSAPRAPHSVATPAPLPRAPSVVQARPSQPPVVVVPGGGATFDPHEVPLPPELGGAVYDWLRRLALQADLRAADRLLRDAVCDLTNALSVVIIYAGPDGLHSLGAEDELPKDGKPIEAVGRARRALVASHTALVPISTANETIAVIAITRNSRQPAFTIVEHVLMAAVARESAAIMHHLVVQHLQRRTEAEADKKSLYRPEALESHRRRGHEGVIAELSPAWVRRTYYVLVACIVVALGFAVFVKIPTYSSGTGVIVFEGARVTAPAPGTVDTIYVQTGQKVHKGDLLVKLASAKEDADLAQADTELETAEAQYLFDSSDEQVRKSLKSAQAQVGRLEAAVEQRSVRASKDGIVSEIRVRPGAGVQFSDPILTITDEGTEAEVWAFLPGNDRPRLHPGQDLQVDITGFTKTREKAKIYEVSRDIIVAAEARRMLGPDIADAAHLTQDGAYVLVKAKLPSRTFKDEHHVARYYHQGMQAKTEVRVESKRFLVTLIPSLEKYVE